MIGITAYGTQIPRFRITPKEIGRVWNKDGSRISKSLGLKEKAVAGFDEDAVTLAVEASRKAVFDFNIPKTKIGAVFVGSESHPYAVNPSATILGEALGIGNKYMAADLEFACKAGTAGIQNCFALCKAGLIEYGLSVGTDTAQGKPNDALEFTAGSGAGAIIVGNKKKEVIAEILHTCSFSSDTPDFWRRPKQDFPMHTGRFTGQPAYFRHVLGAAKMLFEETTTSAKDYDFAVFHQPNGKFPVIAGKKLGFEFKQIEQGLLTPFIGNTYSGATIIGLCSVLDKAKPGQQVLAVSYGSGAGSDAFQLKITKNIEKRRAKIPVFQQIREKEYIDYAVYLKYRRKIKSL